MYLTTWYEANAALAERWARNGSESEGPCFLARRGQRWSWLASLSAMLSDARVAGSTAAPRRRPGSATTQRDGAARPCVRLQARSL